MELSVRDFLAIKRADITFATGDIHITKIAGKNGRGKSCLLMALQACVLQEAAIFPGVPKKDSKILVHDESDKGSAVFKAGQTLTEIVWPSCKITTTKKPIVSSYAAGVKRSTEMSTKDLQKLIQSSPTKDEFEAAIGDARDLAGVPVDDIWQSICDIGWDKTLERSEGKRQELKRQWSKLAGSDYKPTNAKNWFPENYRQGVSIEELQTALETAEQFYEHAIKTQALDAKERADLEALAAEHDPTLEKGKIASEKVVACVKNVEEEKAKLAELPKVLSQKQTYECQGCKMVGTIQGEFLIQAEKYDTKKAAKDQAALDAQSNKIAEAEAALAAARAESARIEARIAECIKARNTLSKTSLDQATTTLTPAAAKANVDLARAHIAAFETKVKCDEIHLALQVNAYICSTLDPDGLRKDVLVKKLAEFNDLLAKICSVTGWEIVRLDECLAFWYGKRPYKFCSTAQKFAIDVTVQLAVAKFDGSPLIIIDGVDVLDKELYDGLMRILQNISVPSVIGCKVDSEEACDRGYKEKIYWIENGFATEVPVAQVIPY